MQETEITSVLGNSVYHPNQKAFQFFTQQSGQNNVLQEVWAKETFQSVSEVLHLLKSAKKQTVNQAKQIISSIQKPLPICQLPNNFCHAQGRLSPGQGKIVTSDRMGGNGLQLCQERFR